MLGIADVRLFRNFWRIYRDGIAPNFMPMDRGMMTRNTIGRSAPDSATAGICRGTGRYVYDPYQSPGGCCRRIVKEYRVRPDLQLELQHVPFAQDSVDRLQP